MTAREWTRDEFRAAYERYRAYICWMEKLTGNPTQGEMLALYTKDERAREELMVMYEVTRLLNAHGRKLSEVVLVGVTEDGRVSMGTGS